MNALFCNETEAWNNIYNIACGDTTSLNQMFCILKETAGSTIEPAYGPNRLGDIKDSMANIDKARQHLKYEPAIRIKEGLALTYNWFKKQRNG
jgi:UDP-N-acetylglucosamine 4-epimerase